MLKNFIDKAKTKGTSVKNTDWNNYKNLAKERLDSAGSVVSRTLEDHWPLIEKILIDGLLQIAEEKLRDDVFLADLFEKTYELLPAPVRLIIKRDKYLSFCLKRKEPLLIRVSHFKEERKLENDLVQLENMAALQT